MYYELVNYMKVIVRQWSDEVRLCGAQHFYNSINGE